MLVRDYLANRSTTATARNLVRFNHVEKPLGLFNAIHIANEKLLQSNETHTVLHSHPPSYFGRFLGGSPGIEENHLSS